VGHKIPLFHELFRQKEKMTLGGHVFLAIGAIIAISVFSKEIAILAILMTAVGDAAAAILGEFMGRMLSRDLKAKKSKGFSLSLRQTYLQGLHICQFSEAM